MSHVLLSGVTSVVNKIFPNSNLPKQNATAKSVGIANDVFINLYGQDSLVSSANASMLDQMFVMSEQIEILERENAVLKQHLLESSMFAFEEDLKPLPRFQMIGKIIEMPVQVTLGDAPKFRELRPLSEDE
jgi:hypothetical protein